MMRNLILVNILRWVLVGVICALVTIPGCASSTAVQSAPVLTPAEREKQIESFDAIWTIVRDRHWDPGLNGVDWDAAREELRPRVERAETAGEARAAMGELISRLGQSHFSIVPKETYERLNEQIESDSGAGWSGIEVRLIGDDAVVSRVREGSPASEVGVRTGWVVRSVNGRDMADLVEAMREVEGIEPASTRVALAGGARFGGDVGEEVEAVFLDGEGRERRVALTLVKAPGEIASMGELPPAPVEVVTRTLDSGIGYFYLSIFLDAPRVLREFRGFVREHADAPGLILDLRGNPGGIILMSTGIMNWLVQERDQRLGTLRMRDPERGAYELPIIINPRSTTYDGPVAVLVDEASISNSEILAAGLRDLGRARVFGARTAGLVLPSTFERLPSGDGFQYAFASYESSAGGMLEASGVAPDVEVPLDREALLEGRDLALEAAIDWIKQRSAQ